MNKLIVYGPEARNKIVDGAVMLRDIVASTLGPAGRNVIIHNGGVRPLILKDGATVADNVDTDNPFQKIGVQLIKDIISKVDSVAGDGTTTTTIYSTEVLTELNKLVNLGVDPNELRKGLDQATSDAITYLEQNAEHINDITAIAAVASNENQEIVDLLTEAYNSIGENGSVVLADSWKKSGKSYVEVSNGLNWEGGIPSSIFVTNPTDSTAVVEDPAIMVIAQGVKDIEPLMPFIIMCEKINKPLVLVAPFFEPVIWSTCAAKHVLLLQSPGTSFSHAVLHDALLDLAITVGTKVVPSVESAIDVVPELKDLGRAKLIVSSLEETKITQIDEFTEEHAKTYEEYIEKLKKAIDDDDSSRPATIEAMKERLARLSGGIATIHLGALTPTEKEEKVALIVDAQNSVSSALQYGVLPGGGTALLKTAQVLSEQEHSFTSEAMRRGYEAVLSSMRTLAKQLVSSIKPEDYQYIVQQVAHEKDFWTGYNVRTKKIESLKDSKIYDSAAIEILALKYTASVIGSFVISDGVIVNAVNNVNYDLNDRRAVEIRGGY